ncbi:MAG: hypothetical protein AAHT63_02190 [Akkermansia muciniphila]
MSLLGLAALMVRRRRKA